jgi:hypothetical protein
VDEGRLPEPPKAGSLDARLVKRIREGLTIDEMAKVLHASDFLVYQRLYALYRLEAVKVLSTPPVRKRPAQEEEAEAQVVDLDVIGTESSTSEVVQAAQSYLENGNFRDGEALARRAHEMAPSPQTEALLRSAEAALLGVLRRDMLEKPHVPTLLVPPAQLKSTQLSSPERYLLSRIDGKRDLGGILSMSPAEGAGRAEVHPGLRGLRDGEAHAAVGRLPSSAPTSCTCGAPSADGGDPRESR